MVGTVQQTSLRGKRTIHKGCVAMACQLPASCPPAVGATTMHGTRSKTCKTWLHVPCSCEFPHHHKCINSSSIRLQNSNKRKPLKSKGLQINQVHDEPPVDLFVSQSSRSRLVPFLRDPLAATCYMHIIARFQYVPSFSLHHTSR